MTVEETTQLIQLVLNSVLMVLACSFVLGGLLLRRSVLENRLQITSVEYLQILNRFEQPPERLIILKKQLRYLQQRVKFSRNGILVLYFALMLFITSTFALSMRTVLASEWLVSSAMVLFTIGIAVLLFSVAIVLLDFYQSERPFWQEMRELLDQPIPKRRAIKLRKNPLASHRIKITR